MRLLILSSSTGGGHDMRARSIEQWSGRCSTDTRPIKVHRYQALEESARIYHFGVHLYNLIQKKCPALHHLYFNWLEVFHVSASEPLLLGKQRFIERLQSVRPDIIVSVHAHTNHAFRSLAKRTLPKIRFVTYCGEMHGGYGFSRHWVDPGADAFIGATEAVCKAAKSLGMPPQRVRLGGFLLHPKFFEAPLSGAEKQRLIEDGLRLDRERFTLILSTGANGANNHAGFIAALEAARLPIQIIALCGRDEAAAAHLNRMGQGLKFAKVLPLGYRNDMFALMQIADAIVARPGTGTTSEAIMAGCPLLLNTVGGVMPQEWITVKYLRSKGLPAQRIRRHQDLVSQVSMLTKHPADLAAYKEKMRSLRPSKAPPEIFKFLFDLAN